MEENQWRTTTSVSRRCFPWRISSKIHHMSWVPTMYRVPRRKTCYTTLGIEKNTPTIYSGKCKKKDAVPSVVCIILKITAFFIITLLARLYGRIGILLICGNNLHNGIISPRGETWAHTTRHQEGRIGPIQLGTKRGGLGPYN